jgi:hypothetical protein
MGSKLFIKPDQGFRFAPPLASCFRPFQGLQNSSRSRLGRGSAPVHETSCGQPVASSISLAVHANENRYSLPGRALVLLWLLGDSSKVKRRADLLSPPFNFDHQQNFRS